MSQLDLTTGHITIDSPNILGDHANLLLNDRYVLRVGETLQGPSKVLEPAFRPRNHIPGSRQFFIRFEDGFVWNINQESISHKEATFKVIHDLHQTTLETQLRGLGVTIRVFVPPVSTSEIWTIDLVNQTNTLLVVDLFTSIDFEHGGVMESHAAYDKKAKAIINHTFPYHVSYDDKGWLERTIPALTYMYASVAPKSYGTSKERFMGTNRRGRVPKAITLNTCDNIPTTAVQTAGIMQHQMVLSSHQKTHLHLVIGVALEKDAITKHLSGITDAFVEARLCDAKAFTDGLRQSLLIETPDKAFDHKFNGWFKKQLYNMSVNNRMSAHYPIRNVLQDAMGYALLDPEAALQKLIAVLETQTIDGFIQQWQHVKGTGPNGLARLTHSDGPIWLVLTGVAIIEQTGDATTFEEKVSYKDAEPEPIRNHFIRAIQHMAQATGPHGLCLMKDGDWTDPINGIGREGYGESTWNTLSTIVAIDRMMPYIEDESEIERLKTMKERLTSAIRQHAITKTHVIAGYDDYGHPFGDDSNIAGKRYLNVHTWALMTDMLTDQERLMIQNVIKEMDTPLGPVLIDPPYMDYDPMVGRISLKKAGTTENGSIYNHAVMFKAYAESVSGDPDAALSTILSIMPDHKDNPNRHLQIPSYMPNYAFGLKDSPDFGRSSGHDSTGTTAWIYWVLVESILGIRASTKGLEILDIPATRWPIIRLIRQFKGTTYTVLIRHSDRFAVTVDGIPQQLPVLPYQKTTCHVVVERRVI